MRKTRVKAIKSALPKRIFRGEPVAPSPQEVRKAKRSYAALRRGRVHVTHPRQALMVADLDGLIRASNARKSKARQAKRERRAERLRLAEAS